VPPPEETRQQCARTPNTLGQGRERDTEALSGLLEAHSKLFENQGAGAAILDLEGNCLACNPALERMLGNGVTKGTCAIRPEDLRRLHSRLVETNLWKRIRKRGGVTNQELELPGTKGKKIHVLANAAVLEAGPDGNHFVFVSMVDVGRLKKTERELQRTIDRVSSLAKSLQETLRAREEVLETLRRDLAQAHRSLKKVNDATGLLTARIREQTQDYQNRIIHDFNLTVRPLMEHLKSLHPAGPETHLLEAMDFNMRHIASQFGVNLSKRQVRLSPRETEICAMIRAGKDSRQMARSLGLAYETIIVHRKNIRKKLGLKRKKQNLATYIMENM
jgi:PAS domain S-box-containing protein